jgi:hypothetical protein
MDLTAIEWEGFGLEWSASVLRPVVGSCKSNNESSGSKEGRELRSVDNEAELG